MSSKSVNQLFAAYRPSTGFQLPYRERELSLSLRSGDLLLSLFNSRPVRFPDRIGPPPLRFSWGRWRPNFPPRRRLPRFKFSLNLPPSLFLLSSTSTGLPVVRRSLYLYRLLNSVRFYNRLRTPFSVERTELSSSLLSTPLPLFRRKRGGCFVRSQGLRFFLPNRRTFAYPTSLREPKEVFKRNRRGSPLLSAIFRAIRFLPALTPRLRSLSSFSPFLTYLLLRLRNRFVRRFERRVDRLRWYRFFDRSARLLFKFPPFGDLPFWRGYGFTTSLFTNSFRKRLLSRPPLLRRSIYLSSPSLLPLYHSLPTGLDRRRFFPVEAAFQPAAPPSTRPNLSLSSRALRIWDEGDPSLHRFYLKLRRSWPIRIQLNRPFLTRLWWWKRRRRFFKKR